MSSFREENDFRHALVVCVPGVQEFLGEEALLWRFRVVEVNFDIFGSHQEGSALVIVGIFNVED